MGKYQVVLDTETVGGFSKPLVYDFSYCIFNKWTGKTIENHTFIIDEIFSDSALMNTKLRSLDDECRYVFRSKVLNPKFLNGLNRENSKT